MNDDEREELETVEDQITDHTPERMLFGPFCRENCGIRTNNPSKICTKCLGKSACRWCKGTGLSATGGACLTCPGTGLRKEE